MADQNASIGAARLDLVISTEQFDAAIGAAKRTVSDMSQAAQAEYNRLSAAQKRATDSAIRQANSIGQTREQQILFNAAMRGVPLTVLEQLRDKINATGVAASSSGKQLNAYGVSAAQTAAALRGVPAQLTDIVVGLQGGQKPLTVLLQQGGQLKDMFGGIVPAAQGLATAVLDLVNPYALAGAAIAAFAIAASSGTSEQKQFQQSLITSGNAVGQTTSGLTDLATRIGAVTGSRGKAVDALNQIAASGLGAGRNLTEMATAAVAANQVMGRAIDATLKEFDSLKTKPAEALVSLNEKYNFLTAAVYEQIATLERQGRTQDAVALAQKTYAAAVQEQAADVKRSLGTLETGWNSITQAAGRAWEAMKGVGRAATADDLNSRLQDATARLAALNAGSGFATNGGGAAFGDGGKAAVGRVKGIEQERDRLVAEIQMLQQQADQAAIVGIGKRQEAEKIAATQRLDSLKKETETNKQKRDQEIAQVQKDAQLTGMSLEDQNKLIAQINEKYKDPAVKAYTETAGAKLLDQWKQAEVSLTAQIVSEQKLGSWAQKQAEFEQQIADLKGKKILTADQKSILANQDALEAQLAKNVALEKEQKTKEANLRLLALEQSLQATLLADQQKYGDQEAAFGLGSQAQQRLTEQTSIYRDYQRQLNQITNNRTTGKIGDDEYQQQTAALRESLDARLALQQDHFAQLDILQSDWTNGATSALADYADQAKNVAASTKSAFSDAFKGAEDAIVEFAQTGKLSVKDLANSVIADLIRISVRSSVTGPLSQALGQGIASLFGGGSTAPTAAQLSASTQGVNSGLPLSFDGGGYTGAGGKYEPAGIVHRGEVVWSQSDIARAGGVAAVEAMRQGFRGYDDGGVVGGAAMPSSYLAAKQRSRAPQVQINIVNQSSNSNMDAKQGNVRFDGEKYVTDIILKDRLKNGPIARAFGGGR